MAVSQITCSGFSSPLQSPPGPPSTSLASPLTNLQYAQKDFLRPCDAPHPSSSSRATGTVPQGQRTSPGAEEIPSFFRGPRGQVAQPLCLARCLGPLPSPVSADDSPLPHTAVKPAPWSISGSMCMAGTRDALLGEVQHVHYVGVISPC